MVRTQWPRETGESNLTLEAAKRRSVFTGTRELTPPGRNAPNGKAAGLRGWAKVTTGQTQFYLFNWLIFQTASLSTERHPHTCFRVQKCRPRFGFLKTSEDFMSRHSLPAHEKIRYDILSAGQTGGLIVREITEITHFGSIF